MSETALFTECLCAEAAACGAALQPQDVLKLCYQAAYGAEHLLTDLPAAKRYFEEEYAAAPPRQEPLCARIGPAQYRVGLAGWKQAGLPGEWLWRMFAASAADAAAGPGGPALEEYLSAAAQQARAGRLAFDGAAWQKAVDGWRAAGGKPVHHSEPYRAARRPAYRVVCARYVRLVPLLERMARLEHSRAAAGPDGRALVAAIDGRSAAGKTTMARQLAQIVGAGVVHMDDFFLPPELRTPERYAQPGGNVHYERFAAEVLPQLAGQAAFAYRRFDCGRMALGGQQTVQAGAWRIVEGAYSCHPRLGGYMDLRVFADVAPAEQLRRITARNGEAQAERFARQWIPLEEAYLAAYDIPARADVTL